jgi:hypothetical protein
LKMEVSWSIFPGWLWTMIFSVSASQMARLTDVSHQHQDPNRLLQEHLILVNSWLTEVWLRYNLFKVWICWSLIF